jgi:hypothetical protein
MSINRGTMARGVTRIGAAVGAGLLLALLAAGPAGAAPPDGSDPAVAASGSKVPAPVTGQPAPAGSKLGTTGQTAANALPMHLDGSCNAYTSGTGDLCLWYFSGYGGSRVDFYYSDSNLWTNVFLSAGSGQGAVVANNSESAYNYDSIYTAWVCTSTSYNGSCGYILPRRGGNFVPTYFNNSESLYWTL